jgi:hypothetical protein
MQLSSCSRPRLSCLLVEVLCMRANPQDFSPANAAAAAATTTCRKGHSSNNTHHNTPGQQRPSAIPAPRSSACPSAASRLPRDVPQHTLKQHEHRHHHHYSACLPAAPASSAPHHSRAWSCTFNTPNMDSPINTTTTASCTFYANTSFLAAPGAAPSTLPTRTAPCSTLQHITLHWAPLLGATSPPSSHLITPNTSTSSSHLITPNNTHLQWPHLRGPSPLRLCWLQHQIHPACCLPGAHAF